MLPVLTCGLKFWEVWVASLGGCPALVDLAEMLRDGVGGKGGEVWFTRIHIHSILDMHNVHIHTIHIYIVYTYTGCVHTHAHTNTHKYTQIHTNTHTRRDSAP